MNNLNPKEKKLYQRIDEVIHYLWDPIGISSLPPARDEYYEYLPKIFKMLIERKNLEEVAKYLMHIRVSRIGLKENDKKDTWTASVLIGWWEYIQEEVGQIGSHKEKLSEKP